MGVIGTARLIGVHSDTGCRTPWGMRDSCHWQLADARAQAQAQGQAQALALAIPVPATGQLGLWTPPDDVYAQLTAGAAA